jgi:6-pyruvoyltetrahydropterin/6-carboxytetrahydropterin synthase
MNYIIDKRFDFCYGHRVYVQKLRTEFCSADDTQCKCRHNHGHQGALYVHVSPLDNQLNTQSMVVDFKELGWLKDVIDDYIDHKFIIDYNDPVFYDQVLGFLATELRLQGDVDPESNSDGIFKPVPVLTTDLFKAWIINPEFINPSTPAGEVLEGYLIVNFVPTSEMLSAWMGGCVINKMSSICNLDKVIWSETPKTSAVFIP